MGAVYINETNLYKPLLTFWTSREVDVDEELCISYLGSPEDLPPMVRWTTATITRVGHVLIAVIDHKGA